MTTRSIVRQCLAPALALTLLASAGCKREGEDLDREAARTGEGALDETKRQTGQAYDQAKEAQETAGDKTEEAMKKGEEVIDKREDLTEAQKEMQQQQQEAQRAQQAAQESAQGAQQQGQMAQEQDKAAQEQDKAAQEPGQTAQQPGQTGDSTMAAATTAEGTVETASQDELVIKNDTGTTLRLDVDPQATTVLKDGKPATLTDLQQGAKVKVEYRTERGQQVATRIEVGAPADEG